MRGVLRHTPLLRSWYHLAAGRRAPLPEGVAVLKERILEAIGAFVEGHEQADDITLVLLERIAS